MFTSKPAHGAALRQTLDRIEEMWMEMGEGDLDASTARMMHRDLFELLGMVKALVLSNELLVEETPNG